MKTRILLLLVITSVCAVAQPKFKPYSSAAGAFAVKFPGDPVYSVKETVAEEGFKVKVYNHLVNAAPVVAYVLYNEMQAGVNLLDDTLYLNTIVRQFADRFNHKPKNVENITLDGFPGKSFQFDSKEGIVKAKIFLRTNRAYFIVGVYPPKQQKELDEFMSSFKFLPYEKATFTPFRSDEHYFQIGFPSKPVMETDTDDKSLQFYYSFEPKSGNNYTVGIEKYSPYVQYENDSALLALRVDAYRSETDSIIREEDVKVDGVPAKDILVQRGVNYVKMKVRMFTNGGIGYTVFTFLPENELAAANEFFDSFKFTKKVPGNVFSDKADLILKDLQSNDTTVWHGALSAFENYPFEEKHVSKIQDVIKKNFKDDADTVLSRKETMLNTLAELASPTSVKFITSIFPTLKGKPRLELAALNILAKENSTEANGLLLELLKKHTPTKSDFWKYNFLFSYYRLDSTYVKDYFGKTLPLLTTSPYKPGIYALMNNLLKANSIQFNDVSTYRSMMSQDLEQQVRVFQTDTIYQSLDDLMDIIAYGPLDKKDVESLQKLANSENFFLACKANTALLRQNQKVNEKDLTRIAKDRYFRVELFSALQNFGQEKHFPKAFARQDSLAISELYSYLSDEYSAPSTMKIVHQQKLTFRGVEQKFFVIKTTDENGDTYQTVAGPYPLDKLVSWAELTGASFDDDSKEPYAEYLKKYIKAFEEE